MNCTTYELLVLRNGWTKPLDEHTFSSACTISLLLGQKRILVDPGGPWDTDMLRSLLHQRNIEISSIDYVICTHEHVDHMGSLCLFPDATQIVGTTLSTRGAIHHNFCTDKPYEIDSNIKIVYTPGHADCDISVVVLNVHSYGRVAIAGDIFECEEDLKSPELWRTSSANTRIQQFSREKLINEADFIVPGHGPLFKVPEDGKQLLLSVHGT
ncbi:unnamed protein product [Calicophoron daubneyi]|uniref:Metallo-beta-lactamase domain-containing protein 1 n=1 Tax=Calicophoron daubneyi TaxID=300641 RepID=A0AAV2TDL4_CALDB